MEDTAFPETLDSARYGAPQRSVNAFEQGLVATLELTWIFQMCAASPRAPTSGCCWCACSSPAVVRRQ
jgi:hypothetical protein